MSFARYTTQTFLARAILVGFGLVAGIINARWLGPEGVGILALLILVQNFAFFFGNLGFGSAFAFYVARKRASPRQTMKLLWPIGTLMSIVSVIAILAIWHRGFSPWSDMRPAFFYLCLPLIPLFFFNNYLQRVLSGELRITEMNIANLIMGTAHVFFLVILVILMEIGVAGAILSLVLSGLLTLFYLVLRCSKFPAEAGQTEQAESGAGRLTLNLWRYGRWNYLIMFANFFIEELPLIILKKLSTYNIPVGLFARARGLGRQSRLVAFPVSRVLFPYTAASQKAEATNRTNVLCRNCLFLMLPAVGLVALFIKPLILLLYGEEFMPAAKIFYAIAPGIVLWPLGHFLAVHVAASGKPKAVFYANAVTAVTTAAICYFLIPRYGALGAGLSTSAIYLIRLLLQLAVYARVTGSGFSKVILPCRADWKYYKHILETMTARFGKKRKSTYSA